MRYQITSAHGIPEDMKECGYVRTLIVECGAAHLPFDAEIDAGGAVADFNGFAIELKPGDRVKALDD